MKRIICISGDAACGKTTTARLLLEQLPGWQVVSSGGVFREHCARHGIDPQLISTLGDELHRQVDAEMRRKLLSERDLIAEARLVGYLARDLTDVLRVFCDCPLPIRAERFRRREPGFSPEEALRRVAERDAADTANLRHLYGVDYHDPAYYHLVLDTSVLSPEEVAERILSAARTK
jgi:predicted cytidylate kinase